MSAQRLISGILSVITIEAGIGYGEWLHGEAVSVGMVMAADMSARLGWMNGTIFQRTLDLLSKFNLPVEVPNCMTKENLKRLWQSTESC